MDMAIMLTNELHKRLNMELCDEFMQLASKKFPTPMDAAINFAFLAGACTESGENPAAGDKESLKILFQLLSETGADMMRLAKEKMNG